MDIIVEACVTTIWGHVSPNSHVDAASVPPVPPRDARREPPPSTARHPVAQERAQSPRLVRNPIADPK